MKYKDVQKLVGALNENKKQRCNLIHALEKKGTAVQEQTMCALFHKIISSVETLALDWEALGQNNKTYYGDGLVDVHVGNKLFCSVHLNRENNTITVGVYSLFGDLEKPKQGEVE